MPELVALLDMSFQLVNKKHLIRMTLWIFCKQILAEVLFDNFVDLTRVFLYKKQKKLVFGHLPGYGFHQILLLCNCLFEFTGVNIVHGGLKVFTG